MRHYPYLDLTVLPDVRDLVISARAAIIMDSEMSQIFWANGEGVKLLGCQQVDEVLETAVSVPSVMKRQILAAVGRLDHEASVSASIRISGGWKSKVLGFNVSTITLPEQEQAVLLVTASLHGRTHTIENMAASAVSCLAGSGYVSAVLDERGNIIYGSTGYLDLAIGREIQAMLVDEVVDEDDRLVKRMVDTDGGQMAAGIARLSEDPALHLLIMADAEDEPDTDIADDDHSPALDSQPEDGDGAGERREELSGESEHIDDDPQPREKLFSSRRPSLNKGDGGTGFQRWYYRQPEKDKSAVTTDDTPATPQQSDDTAEPVDELPDFSKEFITDPSDTDQHHVATEKAADTNNEPATSQHELRLVNDDDANTQFPDEPGDFTFTTITRPVRFAWRMDASNIFTTVSPELAQTIGPHAAGVVGKSWVDVANAFGFDKDGSINKRLSRGDTWSGKSVLWPVDGTNLRAPVDLAGLPSFDQNRTFTGYHGFGTVRTADAVGDPAPTGLTVIEADADDGRKVPEEKPPVDVSSANDTGNLHDQDALSKTTSADTGQDKNNDAGKIVDLKQQRQARTKRELSVGERAAFKEIAEQLSDAEANENIKPDIEVIGGKPSKQENKTDPNAPEQQIKQTTDERTTAEQTRSNTPAGCNRSEGEEEKSHSYLPSAFAGQAAAHRQYIDTSILAGLPIAVLIFKDQELLFANQEFSILSGYSSTKHLLDKGGIETLLGTTDGETDGYTRIIHESGGPIAVKAHLQSVPWDGERALLLALREELNPVPARKLSLANKPGNHVALDSVSERPSADFGGISSSELSGILDTATDGVIVLNANGEIRSINRAAEALFGYDADSVRGEKFTHLLARESHRAALDYFEGLSENGFASILNDGREMIGKEMQGGLIPLFVTMGRLEESDGYCAVLRDITQWKKAEEDLVAARRQAELASDQKTDFLAKISHEIRTPLNAIIGFSEIMLEERFGKISIDRYREYLRDINRSGGHVLDLVNDLLDISKIEAGKLELDFSEVNLNDIVAEGVALTQPQANREQIIIRTSLSGAVPPVVADPRSIRQIILNLVSNAIKYTRAGGQVIVSTVYEETGEVVLRVRDTGIGMSESEITTAMMPFRRVQTIAHHEGEGTGLGLPLTKALVEANRAQFSIESTPGVGTLVEIYIPSTRVLTE